MLVSAAPTSPPLVFSYYLILALSSPPSFLLPKSLAGTVFLSFSIRLQWVPGHSFLPGNDSADKLARRGALLVPSAISCSLSSLISRIHSSLFSRIHSSLFSDWRHTVSSKFFDSQVPSISTEELVLLRQARCVLSRLRCNGHSLLLSSYFSRNGRIENPSCSACGHSSQDTSHLILHCPATDSLCPLLFDNFLSLQPLVQTLESFPTSGAPLSSAINPSLGITSHSATCYHKIPLLFIHTEHHYI